MSTTSVGRHRRHRPTDIDDVDFWGYKRVCQIDHNGLNGFQIFVCSPLSFIIFHLAKRLLLPPCYPTPVGQPILPFQCRIAPTRKYSGGYLYNMYAREEKKAKMGSADLLRTSETPDTGPVRDTGRSPSRWATPTHSRRDTSPYSGS